MLNSVYACGNPSTRPSKRFGQAKDYRYFVQMIEFASRSGLT